MQDVYGHRGVPANGGVLIHAFGAADRGRFIHTATLVTPGGREGWFNNYIPDFQAAHRLAWEIHYHLMTDPRTGISHRVARWPVHQGTETVTSFSAASQVAVDVEAKQGGGAR